MSRTPRRGLMTLGARLVLGGLLLLLGGLLLVGCQLVPRHAGPPPHAPALAFALPSHNGDTVALASLLERGPAVVVFYRGFW